MNILLLSGFNNYFNRRIVKYSSIDDYLDTDHSDDLLALEKINFNPNDNVGTKIILNTTLDNADYLVVYDDDDNIISRWFVLSNVRQRNGQYEHSLKRDVIADNLDTLMTSPIYVHKGMLSEDNPLILNSEGMSFNQIKTDETLLKDISNVAWLVGYISKNCPAEDITTSAQDTILEYTTLTAIATAMGTTEATLSSLINIGLTQTSPSFFTNKLTLAFSTYYGETELIPNTNWIKRNYDANILSLIGSTQEYTVNTDDKNYALYKYIGTTSSAIQTSLNNFDNATISNATSLKNAMPTYTSRGYYLTSSQLEIFKSFANQNILYNGVYYKLQIVEASNRTYTHINRQNVSGYTVLNTIANTNNTSLVNGRITLRTEDTECYIQLVEIDTSQNASLLKTKVSSSRATCKNQVYDMFAIPYGNVKIYIEADDKYYNGISSEQALKLAIEIARELDAEIYDLQLLPYCPYLKETYYDDAEEAICLDTTNILDQNYSYIYKTNSSATRTYNFTDDTQWSVSTVAGGLEAEVVITPVLGVGESIISIQNITFNNYLEAQGWRIQSGYPTTDGSTIKVIIETQDENATTQDILFSVDYRVNGATNIVSVLYWCNSASFQTQLNYSLSIEESRKLDSQCNMYRLVSPNYQGSFEFNVAKNGTSIDYFTAYCTYKPYTPFIKVEPQFSGLYGTNFNDNRGLICGGDFSIPRFTDRWETYELNNKNYQNIFNREIANLDFNNQIAMRNQLINATTGVVGDTVKGAGAGAMVGGGWGAIAGAVVGLGTSTIGAVYDTMTLQREQHENRQLAIDKFNFSLGNIKALPYTLTKVGAFDISSKLFPFVEYYTCTNEEKQMLRDKITYESMTVFKIDYFGNYVSQDTTKHYFKGELIRNLDLYVATNVFNEIYNELLKGVYI